ncbi:DUF1565 domain-containing protein [Hymenobacter terrenus]|uniref:DUF1565 domain-containing protein n=1 Tax=Hymenobacter terrenus TaxID=1629124 RepID=UPI0006976EFA|nr:DUF1565 domain-containing protein [Hymenobacter terrenus]
MKGIFSCALLFALVSRLACASVWHVAGTGNDANDGKTEATAFRSLQHAADLVQPGDVVLVSNGTYTSTSTGEGSAVLAIRSSGRPDAWVTWKARPGHHPEIRPVGWTGISITGSYQLLEGLTVLGNNYALVLLHVQEDAKKTTPDPRFNTNGIFINGRPRQPNEKPHHVIIRKCDPCFINSQPDPTRGDFRLAKGKCWPQFGRCRGSPAHRPYRQTPASDRSGPGSIRTVRSFHLGRLCCQAGTDYNCWLSF